MINRREVRKHIGGTQRDSLNRDQFRDIERGLEARERSCIPVIKGEVGTETSITVTYRFNGIQLKWVNNACVTEVKIYVSDSADIDTTTDYIGTTHGDSFYLAVTPGTWYFMLIPTNTAGVDGAALYGEGTSEAKLPSDVDTYGLSPIVDASYNFGEPGTRYENVYISKRLQWNAATYLTKNATANKIELHSDYFVARNIETFTDAGYNIGAPATRYEEMHVHDKVQWAADLCIAASPGGATLSLIAPGTVGRIEFVIGDTVIMHVDKDGMATP